MIFKPLPRCPRQGFFFAPHKNSLNFDVTFCLRKRQLVLIIIPTPAFPLWAGKEETTPVTEVTEPDTAENCRSIREMCDAFDVTPRTLRFYEAKELLFPIRDGQRRLFTRRDSARLKLILRGKRFGFSLEEIRQLLDLYDIGDQQETQLTRTLDVARERHAAMIAQREELTQAIADLEDQLIWVEDHLAAMKKKNS